MPQATARAGRPAGAVIRRLRIYERGFALALDLIRLTNHFPKPESKGLCAEIRSTAVRLPAAIDFRGGGAIGPRLAGLHRAMRHIARLEVQILIASELGYLKRSEYLRIEQRILELRSLAAGLEPRPAGIPELPQRKAGGPR